MKFLLCMWLGLVPLVALGAEAPEQVLEKHGLKQVGGLWHVTTDLRIAERVQKVERLERRLGELRDRTDTLLGHNQGLKSQLATLIEVQKAARAARKSVKSGSPDEKRWDEQIKQQDAVIEQLKKSIVPADKLGATMPLKAVAMDLVTVHSEAAFHLLSARRQIQRSLSRYEHLQKNQEVAAALWALEPAGQLAPPRTYANELRSLDRIEKLIFTDDLPLFREGQLWRGTGVANEELPITFTFHEAKEPIVITHTAAESLGLELSSKPKSDLKLGNADVKVTTVRLESLRFGRHVLQDVEVQVLAPENEHPGSRIGLEAIEALRVRVVPERLLLRLEPNDM